MHNGNSSFAGIEKGKLMINNYSRTLEEGEAPTNVFETEKSVSVYFWEGLSFWWTSDPLSWFVCCCCYFNIAKYQFKAEIRRRMGFSQSSFLNAAYGRKTFQLDSYFPYGNSGSCFGILNLCHFLIQNGEVVFGFGIYKIPRTSGLFVQ